MRRQTITLVLLAVTCNTKEALAQSVDPTPGTTPPIELDGSIGPGGDVPFDGTTWSIGDDLGEYGSGGSSLFHSFGRFDIPSAQVAEFSAAQGAPERVFARVTWGERSNIEGVLRSTIPGADVYLINPAGVRFEGGADVDIQGSFVATSAGRIDFADGATLSADVTTPPPLLSVAEPSHYGFLPESPAAIEFGRLDVSVGPLAVPAGETFAAIGGRVEIRGGGQATFQAPGARIALIAAGAGVEVPADLASFDPTAIAPEVALGDVDTLGTRLLASLPAGTVLVRAGDFKAANTTIGVVHNGAQPSAFSEAVDVAVRGTVSLEGGSSVSAVGSGAGRGGDILLAGDEVIISGSDVNTTASSIGPGSDLLVQARLLRIEPEGRLRTESRNVGAGGALQIEVSRLEISDAGFGPLGTAIATTTTSRAENAGNAGSLEIDADSISLRDGAQIFSSTNGVGNAGRVSVRAGEIDVSGISRDPTGQQSRAALIETRALPGSTGHAGEARFEDGSLVSVLGVTIETDTLRVADGAEVGTATRGLGNAGDLVLDATESVLLEGGSSGPATLQSRAAPLLGNVAVGAGGRIEITTPTLELRDGGQITSATTGTGDAGAVEIRAGRVEIQGQTGFNQSGIFAQTLAPGLAEGGDAGSVRIETTGDIALRDGATILVETANAGQAGRVEIDTGGRLVLDDAAISARATEDSTAASGSIEITADEGVFLSNGSVIGSRSFGTDQAGTVFIDAGPRFEARDSQVSTESITLANPGGGVIEIVADQQIILTDSFIDTSVAAGGGDGGDVRIDPDLVVLNRSAIRADAADGNGGNIFIRAGSFVISSDSVVSATSLGGGIDGTVVIESPESELNTERAQPAQEFLDAAGLLKTACGAGSGAGAASSFVVTQVAGLPASPEGPLPAPLWDALPSALSTAEATPQPTRHDARPLRVAARAGGCEARVEEL